MIRRIFIVGSIVLILVSAVLLAYQQNLFEVQRFSQAESSLFQSKKQEEQLLQRKVTALLSKIIGFENFEVLVSVQLQGKSLSIERLRKKPRKYELKNTQINKQAGESKDESSAKESSKLQTKALKSSPGFADILTVRQSVAQEPLKNNNATGTSSQTTENEQSEQVEGVYFDINKEVKTVAADSVKTKSVLIILNKHIGEERLSEIKQLRPYLIQVLGLSAPKGDVLEIQASNFSPKPSFSQKIEKIYFRNQILFKLMALILLSLTFSVFVFWLLKTFFLWRSEKNKQLLSKRVEIENAEDIAVNSNSAEIADQKEEDLLELLNFWLDKKGDSNA